MKQTNYHLFDLMDFDPALEKDEVLWKAYAPTTIKEQDGDIVVTIPYQQQLHQALEERATVEAATAMLRPHHSGL